MKKRLTLSMDDKIILQAKEYAKANNVSLSKLVENHLATLSSKNNDHIEITATIEPLSKEKLPQGFDYKKSKKNYLKTKYK